MNKKDIDMLVEKYSKLNETNFESSVSKAVIKFFNGNPGSHYKQDIHTFVKHFNPEVTTEYIDEVIDRMSTTGAIKSETKYYITGHDRN